MKRTMGCRFLCFLLCLLLCAGCAPGSTGEEATFFAMDTIMTVSVRAGGKPGLAEQAQRRVEELEGLLSATDGDSEIYALNREGGAELSPDSAQLLSRALELCARTGGALDVSIYPVLRSWGFTTGDYAVPDQGELEKLLPLVDYRKVRLEGNRASLPAGMEIDLGSVAKGYAGDRLSDFLKEKGVTSALLDLGGNIQSVGSKPDGSPWRVGVRDPDGTDNLGIVEVSDQAVVTSGGYERFFEENGVRYWHILDPKTGAPARNGLKSVTIVGDSGLLCDALSTALFVMGLEGALDHWRQYRDFEAVFVSDGGGVTITPGLEERFTLVQTDRPLAVAQP